MSKKEEEKLYNGDVCYSCGGIKECLPNCPIPTIAQEVPVSTAESLRQICEIQKEMMGMMMTSLMEPFLKKQEQASNTNLFEITQLIDIRNYIATAINNFSLNKIVSRELSKMLILVDKRISEKLISDEFKNYINFENAGKALAEVMEANNIKSGMNPSETVVAISSSSAHILK